MEKTTLAVLLFALLSVGFLYGCAQNAPAETVKANQTDVKTMPKNDTVNTRSAQKGDIVSVDYVGKLENGTLFDTSIESEAKKAGLPLRPKYSPLQFTVGAGQMIAGFDAAVVGMKEGDEKTVTMLPEKAYGMPSKERMFAVDASALPNGTNVGDTVYDSDGNAIKIVEIKSGKATMDFNHPLAGKTLVFYIKMVKVGQ